MGANSLRISTFWDGVKSVFPLGLSILPIGIIFGAKAVEGGFNLLQTMGSSFFLVGGVAQIVSLNLFHDKAATLFIISAALIINLRHVIYSASLAEASKEFPHRNRRILSYFLTDECFATLQDKIAKKEKVCVHYFFGVGLTLWVMWQLSTVVGVALGNRVPAWMHFNLITDFVFLAFIVKAASTRKLVAALCVAFVVSSLLIALPYKLNVLLGAVVTVLALMSFHRVGSLKEARA